MHLHHRLGALVATLTLFVAPAAFACGGYGHQAQAYAPVPAPVAYAPAPVVYAPPPAPVVYHTATYNAHMHNKHWTHAARLRMAPPMVVTKPVVVVQAPQGHHGHPGAHNAWGAPAPAPTVVVQPAPQPAYGGAGFQGHGGKGHRGKAHGKQFAHAGW